MPGVEIASNQAVAVGGEVSHIVNDLGGGWLSIYIEDLVVIDADPEEVMALDGPMLLGTESGSFANIGHNTGMFTLPVFFTVPGVNQGEVFVGGIIRSLSAREGEGLLDANHITSALKGKLEGDGVAGCRPADVDPAYLQVTWGTLLIAASAAVALRAVP
ncbi:hypothetical protein CDV55_100350 [Aspergillus turcosus]|nr:hypothetical protein CDV55_100350 [Aspergillus turcosus]